MTLSIVPALELLVDHADSWSASDVPRDSGLAFAAQQLADVETWT